MNLMMEVLNSDVVLDISAVRCAEYMCVAVDTFI